MPRAERQPFRVYRVGGAVRDELIGREHGDRDWVVVGATPEMMTASGYKPVGSDFPVFLHPDTREEYALARTERKHGRGYRGFEFFASPEVTLEQDLARRDLTINAMARDEGGALIDPYGGADDLHAGILRHVSPAFVEDPLRVLRVARFAARFSRADAISARLKVPVDCRDAARLLARWRSEAERVDRLTPASIVDLIQSADALRRPERLSTLLAASEAVARSIPRASATYAQ